MYANPPEPLISGLSECYEELIKLLDELRLALQSERQTLQTFDAAATLSLAERKSDLVAGLESAENRRQQMVEQVPGLAEFLGDGSVGTSTIHHDLEPLLRKHQDYSALLSDCQTENRQNGLQIKTYAEKTSNAIALLTGQGANQQAPAYDAMGGLSAQSSGRSLGRA